jgi:L-fuconolactonase
MTDELSVLRHDFGPTDLKPLLDAKGMDGTVAVQAREMPEETDYLLALAAKYPFIKGVVGWLDLCDPGIEPEIELAARNSLLKGFRMLIHDRPDKDFASSPAHLRGVKFLETFDLAYDLLLKTPHIAAAIDLVDALPNQTFILDHIAKPDIKGEVMEPWATELARLAKRQNVSCKLSSLATQADWATWQLADYNRYLDHVLRCFGADRLMIGSDWPVCTLVAGYEESLGIVRNWTSNLSAGEQSAILGETAHRVYRLG